MSMMMRRGMMVPKAPGGLPAEYLAVQYIQAIPGAYINSGYVPTVAPRIETRIQIMSNSDSDLFGFLINEFPSFIVDATNYGSIFYNRWGQTPSTQFTPSSQLKTPTDCVFGKTTIIGSNEYIDAFGDVDWSSNVQVVYIGRGRNITCDVRIYSCKLYDGTALVRDFIPCIRIADSKPGMYDLVGGTFYTNQGTGEFLVGIQGWDHVYLFYDNAGGQLLDVTQGQSLTIEWDCPDNANANGWVINGNSYCSDIGQIRYNGYSGSETLSITGTGQVRIGANSTSGTFSVQYGIFKIKIN